MTEHVNFSWVRRFEIEDPQVAARRMVSEPITDMSSPWREIVWHPSMWDRRTFSMPDCPEG